MIGVSGLGTHVKGGLALFTTTELQGLATTQLAALTATQLGNVTTTVLNNLTAAQVTALTSTQFYGLSATQIDGLSTANLQAVDAGDFSTTQLSHLAGATLTLELTESTLVDGSESTRQRLLELDALADKMIELFHDDEDGGFFFTSVDHERLITRFQIETFAPSKTLP